MYFGLNEESEFHQRLNPVAMAKRQIPNGYKNTTKSLIDRIKTKPVSESEDYIDIDEEYLFDEDAHPRSTRSSLHNPKGFGKVKFVRANLSNMNFKDFDKIHKNSSTPRQYREFLRTNEKGVKAVRQIHGQFDDQKELAKHKISKNFKKHLLRNDDQNQSKRKEFLENIKKNRQFNQQNNGNHPSYKIEYQKGLVNHIRMMGAA